MINLLLLVMTFCAYTKDFSFLNDHKANEIYIAPKTFKGKTDYVFVDGLGREASFQGWNISNISKTPLYGFLPVPNSHGDIFFNHYREITGSNIIRWVINWEAVHPEVDEINMAYLENLVFLLKIAIANNQYIILDYHQDIFSRWIPTKDSFIPRGNTSDWDQDGAPRWIVEGMKLPKGSCGSICVIWSQNYFTNSAVKAAHRNFWNNVEINTSKGKRKVQEEFFWQMKELLSYVKSQLTPWEFSFILGVDAWNEPSEGGLRAYNPPLSPDQWLNEKLMPFYSKVRDTMDDAGYINKFLFAEPSVYWNIGLFLIAPRGEFKPSTRPAGGLVFNAHKYDERRQTFASSSPLINNGAYLAEMEMFRSSARNISAPPLISEFSCWGEKRADDANRECKARYQAMELSPPQESGQKYPNFYSPIISGIRWAWEGGKFDTSTLSMTSNLKNMDLERDIRPYPRRVQGDLMHFYYNDTTKSSYKNKKLEWVGLQIGNKVKFSENKFIFMVWRGRNVDAPSEIFVPNHFNLNKSLIITDNVISYGLNESTEFYQDSLFIFGDPDQSLQFFLAIETDPISLEDQRQIQYEIQASIIKEISPLRFLEKFKIDKPRKFRPNRKPFFLEGE